MDSCLPVEEHPRLYFPDGDVILSARTAIPVSHGLCFTESQDAPPRILLFRVHKAILSHHSPAFKNMFFDAVASAGDAYDGAPLVPMVGDRAEDLAQLLTYLYDPSAAGFRRLDPDKPRRLSGMIRLMDKYLLEKQRKHLIEQVASDWPTTLEDWDIRLNEIKFLKSCHAQKLRSSQSPPPQRTKLRLPDPAVAIAFAREFGCPEILPAAFYQLSITPARNLLRPENRQTAEWTLLSQDDMLRYTEGCLRLWGSKLELDDLLGDECRSVYEAYMESLPEDDMSLDPPECLEIMKDFWSQWSSVEDYGNVLPKDTLKFLSGMMARWNEKKEDVILCDQCYKSLPERLSWKREAIWQQLHWTFSLGA